VIGCPKLRNTFRGRHRGGPPRPRHPSDQLGRDRPPCRRGRRDRVPPLPDLWGAKACAGARYQGDPERVQRLCSYRPRQRQRSGHAGSGSRSMRRSLLRSRSLPATAAGRSRRTATTCAASSSGPPTMASPSWRRAVRTSSCSAPGWRTAGSRRRRSTVDSRRSVASTGSRTSTDASARTQPSTSAGHRSTPRTLAGWIAPSSACSCLLAQPRDGAGALLDEAFPPHGHLATAAGGNLDSRVLPL